MLTIPAKKQMNVTQKQLHQQAAFNLAKIQNMMTVQTSLSSNINQITVHGPKIMNGETLPMNAKLAKIKMLLVFLKAPALVTIWFVLENRNALMENATLHQLADLAQIVPKEAIVMEVDVLTYV